MYKGIIPGIMMVIYSVDGFYGLPMHFTNLTGVAHRYIWIKVRKEGIVERRL